MSGLRASKTMVDREIHPNWQVAMLIGAQSALQVVEALSGKDALDLAMQMFDMTNVRVIHSTVTDTKVQYPGPSSLFPTRHSLIS